MNQVLTLDMTHYGVNEMLSNEMALVDGGLTPYEAGHAAGKLLIIAATIATFFL